MWNLQCAFGAFDITFEPAGGGHDHLAPRAPVITVRGAETPLAHLADVVASKRLANRVKDQLRAERDKESGCGSRGTRIAHARPTKAGKGFNSRRLGHNCVEREPENR